MLTKAYEIERERLMHLAETDTPEGEYASPVFGEGRLGSTVLFIGEAPGAEEARLSRPFVGRAGKQLDALLLAAGIERDLTYVTNVVKYRPVVRSARSVRNRTPKESEIAAALPLLKTEIELLSPLTVVTLGNVPLRAVLRLAECEYRTVGELHGKPLPLVICGRQLVLFPLYHPASGIYNRALLPVMEADVRSLGEHLVKRA